MASPITVVVADDHPLYRAGLGAAIGARPAGFSVTVATRAHPRGAVRARLRRA